MTNRKELLVPKIKEEIKKLYDKGFSLSEIKEYTNEIIEEAINNPKNTIARLSNGLLIL
jgi:predicted DNA-binding protein YlxM (UPF0122 family)